MSDDLEKWVKTLNFLVQKLDVDLKPVWKTPCKQYYHHEDDHNEDDYCNVGKVRFQVDREHGGIVVTAANNNLTCTCYRRW